MAESANTLAAGESARTRSDEAARLEAALERIARARSGAGRAPPAGREELAARLDTLIAEVRAVLGGDSSD